MPVSQSSTGDKPPKIHEYSAGYIVFHVENGARLYLILHYPGGHYDFPKGHLESGESNSQAAIRELEEETGIQHIKTVDGFEQSIIYNFRRKEGLVEKKVTFFLGEAPQKEVKISFEHQGFLWLPYDQALTKITFENARNILRASEKFLGEQVF